jgi:PDZ domain-containing protein
VLPAAPPPSTTRAGDILGRMTRRAASLTVATITLVALVAVAFMVKLPFVVMSPGLTEDTLGDFDGQPVITIEGHRTYPTQGRLDLTTVSVTRPDYRPRLPEVLSAWWSDEQAVLPDEAIYPSDRSPQEFEQEKTQQMLDSQSSAVAAGLAQAGIDAVDITVEEVEPGMPAEGELREGDVIVALDNKPVVTVSELIEGIQDTPVGSEVTVQVLRDGKFKNVSMMTAGSGDSTSRIGVTLGETFNPPFEVNIDLGQEIGGPSAGLMFSLAIYDKLTPGPLTDGRYVAGTGTIEASGEVGPIGGIQQKLAAADHAGADVFLVPADDCGGATASPFSDEMELIRVDTIDDAVTGLEALATGDEASIPRCGG